MVQSASNHAHAKPTPGHNPFSFDKCSLVLVKDLGTFCNTKPNVHRFTLNLYRLKIMIVESFPVVFEKWVKQCHENTFLHAKIIFVSWLVRRKLFSWHCKFNVNLWTLCFVSQKVHRPFKCIIPNLQDKSHPRKKNQLFIIISNWII